MPSQVNDWLVRFVPAWCALCGLPAGRSRLCAGCMDDLPWLSSACRRCGAPLPAGSPVALCAGCDVVMAGLDRVRAALVYEYPVDRLVTAAKFHGRADFAHALGEALARYLATDRDVSGCELVVPVPLHPVRLARRGYNQAELIGLGAAKAAGASLRTGFCGRRRHTQPQSGLASSARRANVRHAFAIRRDVRGLAVAIVDDVLTTGHTVSALARAFRQAGAARVEAWCAARVVTGQDHR